MSHSLVCWKCGASLAALTLPLRRLEVCPRCNCELHVCRMCVEYDTSKAKHCREPIAEEVRQKDQANFCDFYKPREGAYIAPDVGEQSKSRAGLDALFGAKPPSVATAPANPGSADAQNRAPGGQPGVATPAATPSENDEARSRLEDLFKPRKP